MIFIYEFTALGLKKIVAETEMDNTKTIRILESLGMKLDSDYNESLPVWSIYRKEYQYGEI